MATQRPSRGDRSVNWMEMLGAVEKVLERQIEEAAQRQMRDSADLKPQDRWQDDDFWRERLDQLSRCGAAFQATYLQTEETLGEMDRGLADRQQELQTCQQSIQTLRRKLAEWTKASL